jgi:4-hydroxy-3-methylbut-2-enyl diphosphate reductase IspH
MKIILANPRGFCAGVNMAIDSLERALELFGTPLYVYHEIVHNLHVVERFRKRGAVFVDTIDEIPQGATVLYSAHGVAPARPLATSTPSTPPAPSSPRSILKRCASPRKATRSS